MAIPVTKRAAAAEYIGAKVIRVPLRKDYSHDVHAMADAAPTRADLHVQSEQSQRHAHPRYDIEWLVENKPKGSILCWMKPTSTSPGAVRVRSGVKERMSSSAHLLQGYGMAGFALARPWRRPDLLEKLRPYGSGMLPITGLAAATASLKVKTLVAERRKINADVREDVFNWLEQKKVHLRSFGQNRVYAGNAQARYGDGGGDAEGEHLHRPRLACMADIRTRHHRDAG